MKRIKLFLIGAAVLLGVGGAWATRPCVSCLLAQQYIYNGYAYVSVGEYGYDYYCEQAAQNCTWYRPNPSNPNYYVPCKTGFYVDLMVK